MNTRRTTPLVEGAAGPQRVGSDPVLSTSTPACQCVPIHPSPGADLLERGSLFGRYTVLERLGSGGMAEVYAAYDRVMYRPVALKMLRDGKRGLEARLMREAHAMARLSHPNVVAVFDTGLVNGRLLLIMEYVRGKTLRSWRGAEARGWREVLRAYLDAGRGLAAAHAAGLVHRDFKPDNVLVSADGTAKVTDFGLVCAVDARDPGPSSDAMPITMDAAAHTAGDAAPPLTTQLTRHDAVLGTPGYLAPEQYRCLPVDERTDQFAFCLSLYEALYGEKPLEAGSWNLAARSAGLGREKRAPAAPRCSDVPAWVRRPLLRGLSLDPQNRYASMRELLDVLETDPSPRRRGRLALAVVLSGACAVPLAMHGARQGRVRACHETAQRAQQAWDAPKRAAAERAFASTGLRLATDSWTRVEPALDAYANSLAAATEEACTATRVRHERSEETLDLQLACLDDHLDELRALADVLSAADGRVVERAVQATNALQRPETCSDPDRLSATARLPSDPGIRAEIRSLRREIAVSKVQAESGNPKLALDRLRSIERRVAAADYDPLLVRYTLQKATTEELEGDDQAANVDYHRAAQLADSNRLDAEKASAFLGLAQGAGNQLVRAEEGHRWVGYGRAALRRLGDEQTLAAQLDVTDAWLYINEEKPGLAARAAERALARGPTAPSVSSLSARSALAAALLQQGRLDEAVAEQRATLALAEEAYGALHPYIACKFNNVAFAELEGGRPEEALASALHGLELAEGATAPRAIGSNSRVVGSLAVAAGEALVRLGRPAEAIEQCARAREAFCATSGERSLEVADADNSLAEALGQLGRLREAKDTLAEAMAILESQPDATPGRAAATLLVRAKLALRERNFEQAILDAQQALGQLGVSATRVRQLADTRLVLAEAVARAGRDPSHARALARQAAQVFDTMRETRRADDAHRLLN
jgi:tetratricopeptide (TPR) repeat protein